MVAHKVSLLADECCDGSLVRILRVAGYDVEYVRETHPGLPDADIVSLASEGGRILITEDKDFGELVVRHGVRLPGLVLLRLSSTDAARKAQRLLDVLQEQADRIAGNYVVVLDTVLRIRTLTEPP
jgi:predicted nuclease of predicted toxin-antitoxin system